jgi:hypothetical protein
MMKNRVVLAIFFTLSALFADAQLPEAFKWQKYELVFKSKIIYENPVQDLMRMQVIFKSPTGRLKTINSFWDGDNVWKARFMPDETGTWLFETKCSDPKNSELNGQKGTFLVKISNDKRDIIVHGPVTHPSGTYYLTHSDGTPFFYMACTAWNGALRSTEEEWDQYLKQRSENNYSAIQFVTTQWRGGDKNSLGQIAFEGSGRIRINPDFFKLMDKKIDRINDFGLIAVPVILWTLQTGRGRELSPGYYLPDDQAILLAKYIVARYGANHVIWLLGGDGSYTGQYGQRWKTIGRGVFDGTHQGIVTLHPNGRSWIGEDYKDERWLDFIGYQSSHSNSEATVNWITKGPVSKDWAYLPPRPIINLEPNYEEIFFKITDRDVRNACYWSLFAAPIAGITYGANGIWPWLRPGEKILNHEDAAGTSPWYKSIEFSGSKQMGYLAQFIRQFRWWDLFPAQDLLVEQPGDRTYNQFVSLVKSSDNKTIIAYLPVKLNIKIRKPTNLNYQARWFNPVQNEYTEGNATDDGTVITLTSPLDGDLLLILENKPQQSTKINKKGNPVLSEGKSR